MKSYFKNTVLILLFFMISPKQLYSETDKTDKKNIKKSRKSIVIDTSEPIVEKKYKLIYLKDMDFKTVKQIASDWLSKGGLVVHQKKQQAVLVYDTPKVIKKIEKFINSVTEKIPNIRIEIFSKNTGSGKSGGLTVEPIYKNKSQKRMTDKGLKIEKINGIKVDDISYKKTKKIRNTTQFIVTRSGFPASLWVGETRINPQWLNSLIIQPTIIISTSGGDTIVLDGEMPNADDFKWVDVGASLCVCPKYVGNGLIDVELYPEISYLDGKGRKQTVKVEKLSTNLRVADGQPVKIGGLISKNKENYVNLFGPDFFRMDEIGNVMNMTIKANLMNTKQRKNQKFIP